MCSQGVTNKRISPPSDRDEIMAIFHHVPLERCGKRRVQTTLAISLTLVKNPNQGAKEGTRTAVVGQPNQRLILTQQESVHIGAPSPDGCRVVGMLGPRPVRVSLRRTRLSALNTQYATADPVARKLRGTVCE